MDHLRFKRSPTAKTITPFLQIIFWQTICWLAVLVSYTATAWAQEAPASAQAGTSNLVKKLNNPPPNINSLPPENDDEAGTGPEQALRYTPKFQPVMPFSINKDWLVITWDSGPTVELVKQKQGWTISTLVNHLGSFAGSEMAGVNYTLLDPRLVHAWENGFSVKLETESGYDWKSSQWTVPLELGLNQHVKVRKRPINLGADVLYQARRGSNDPRWGIRFTVNFNF